MKHGNAVVHIWPNIMIALNELQNITVEIQRDCLLRKDSARACRGGDERARAWLFEELFAAAMREEDLSELENSY